MTRKVTGVPKNDFEVERYYRFIPTDESRVGIIAKGKFKRIDSVEDDIVEVNKSSARVEGRIFEGRIHINHDQVRVVNVERIRSTPLISPLVWKPHNNNAVLKPIINNPVEFTHRKSKMFLLTVETLEQNLLPLLKAVIILHEALCEAQGEQASTPIVKNISQNSPVSVEFDKPLSEDLPEVLNKIEPLRSKHESLEKIIEVREQEIITSMGIFQNLQEIADLIEKRVISTKTQVETERLYAEIEEIKARTNKEIAETERLTIENERAKLELLKDKLRIAQEIGLIAADELGMTEKAIKIVAAIDAVLNSPLKVNMKHTNSSEKTT